MITYAKQKNNKSQMIKVVDSSISHKNSIAVTKPVYQLFKYDLTGASDIESLTITSEAETVDKKFNDSAALAENALNEAKLILQSIDIADAESIKKDETIIAFLKKEHQDVLVKNDNITKIVDDGNERIAAVNFIEEDLRVHVEFINKLSAVKRIRENDKSRINEINKHITQLTPKQNIPVIKKQIEMLENERKSLQSLNKDYVKQVGIRFTNGTKKMRIAYNHCFKSGLADDLNSLSPEEADPNTAYYDPGTKQVTMNTDVDMSTNAATDDEMIQRHGGAAILFHELGHYLDDALAAKWYDKRKLWNLLHQEYRDYAKKRKDSKRPVIPKADPEIFQASMDDISDIIDGITKGNVSGMFEHGTAYWKSSTEMLPAESIAHIFEAAFEQDKKRNFKRIFPLSYDYLKGEFTKGLVGMKKKDYTVPRKKLKDTKHDRKEFEKSNQEPVGVGDIFE